MGRGRGNGRSFGLGLFEEGIILGCGISSATKFERDGKGAGVGDSFMFDRGVRKGMQSTIDVLSEPLNINKTRNVGNRKGGDHFNLNKKKIQIKNPSYSKIDVILS